MTTISAPILGTMDVKTAEVSSDRNMKDVRLRRVCGDFESVFINYILKSARKALPENGPFDNTNESKIYKSMMDEKMAVSMAKGRGVGLGRLLYEDLSQNLKSSSKRTASAKGYLIR